MDEIEKNIIATVASGVVLAVLGVWLVFSPGGRSFWQNLGTFVVKERGPLDSETWVEKVEGIRTLFILAALALVLALAALIFLVRPAVDPSLLLAEP
jgi:hypothetical protein